jgi:predicted transcriptional regulator
VEPDSEVSVLMELFKRAKVAFVIRAEGKRHAVLDIITRIDLLDYIASKQ